MNISGCVTVTFTSSEQSAQRVASMPFTADFTSARCLIKLHQPQDVDVVSEPSPFYFLSLADLPRRRVPTFDIPNVSLIFLGTRHCITFWPPGPRATFRVGVCQHLFDILHNMFLLFLGTCHCTTFWPPGLSGPGGLSRSPSTQYRTLLGDEVMTLHESVMLHEAP